MRRREIGERLYRPPGAGLSAKATVCRSVDWSDQYVYGTNTGHIETVSFNQ